MFDCDNAVAIATTADSERGSRRWYVVQTHAHKEQTARTHLERQRFSVFLPQIRKTIRVMRRTRETVGPLFPRYLFVTLDLERQGWRCVRSTIGVSSMIMDGDRPRAVPRGLVEELAQHSTPAGGLSLSPRLVTGDTVRFMRGPFADKIGKLIELKDSERAVVLLSLLGAERAVTVDAAQLLPGRIAC